MSVNTSARPGKGRSLICAADEYVVVDLETTGLSPENNRIIEIGAVRVKGGVITHTYSKLVNPGCAIDPCITAITSITNSMVAHAPSIDEILPEFVDFTGCNIVVGHNVNFDVNFLYENFMRVFFQPFSNDFIDTMRMAKKIFPGMDRYRLSDLIYRCGVGECVAHRALSDVVQTYECYEYMKNYSTRSGLIEIR